MSKLLISEPPLLVLPSLAKLIGLNESIFIQQLHYWTLNSKNVVEGERWLYNSYQEWQEQFPFWSTITIRRIIGSLEKQGILISSNFNKLKIDRTKWYRINYERLKQLSSSQNAKRIRPSAQNDQFNCSHWTDGQIKLSRPLPKTTTKTTTKNNTHTNNTPNILEENKGGNFSRVCASSFYLPDEGTLRRTSDSSPQGNTACLDVPPRSSDHNNHNQGQDNLHDCHTNEHIDTQSSLTDRLREWFNGKTVVRLMEEHPMAYLEEKITLTLQACPKNPPAFFTKALKEDWKGSRSLEMDDVLLDAYSEIAKDRARDAAMEERRGKMLSIMPDWEKKWLEDFEQKHGRIEL